MIIGYILNGHDNDTQMFEDDDSPLEKCACCGYRLDFEAFNPRYRLGRKGRRWDIASTYDGQLIVSRKFRDVCERNNVPGCLFGHFEAEPDFFHLVSTNTLPFDHERAKTQFIKKCPICGNFESVVVGLGYYFQTPSQLAFALYRSDLKFASGNAKSPLLVVSSDVRKLFADYGLRGLEFSPALGSE